jgi:Ca-activated chloride channel homolog
MHVRRVSMLFVAVFAHGVTDHAQVTRGRPWSCHLMIPQARSYAPARSPAFLITGVTVGVVIRDRIATTMMEIRVQNPTGTRQKAELLVPVSDGAVVRGFAFEGNGTEPSARLLSRDEGLATYDRIVAQARDPALLEFAGFNVMRSSLFPLGKKGTYRI